HPPPSSPLFSTSFGPRPELLSFPTRRSSDLPQVAGAQRVPRIDDVVLAEAHIEPGLRELLHPRHTATLRVGVHPRLQVRVHQGVDRKSTRLNSSHVSISYAVFCLQQKNTYGR